MVQPNGDPTAAWFEWGATPGNRHRTAPIDVGNGNGVVWVSESVSGLVRNQAYHCRLVASNKAGVVFGADRLFGSGGRVIAWGEAKQRLNTVFIPAPGHEALGESLREMMTKREPLLVPESAADVVAIASGQKHCLAVCSDGGVVAWGDNRAGQTDVPTNLSNVVAVAGGSEHSLALCHDGTVVTWGGGRVTTSARDLAVPAGLSNVIEVAAGHEFSLALRRDGTLLGWGGSYRGHTDLPAGLSNVVAIAAGYAHGLALCSDGTVVAWGSQAHGKVRIPSSLSNVTAVAAGFAHSLSLCEESRLAAWGAGMDDASGSGNSVGISFVQPLQSRQSVVPTGLGQVVALAGGYAHSLALKRDGAVSAWGGNAYGQTSVPDVIRNAIGVAAGDAYSLALVLTAAP